MLKLKPVHIAWLLPFTYLIHLAEEFYAGEGLPVWFSDFFNTSLSVDEFITINLFGFGLITFFAIIYSLGLRLNLVLLAFGTLVFMNGLVHITASIFTVSYAPGTISGFFLYIPLGIVTFKKILPQLSGVSQILGILIGILIHIMVTGIAMYM